MLPNNYIIFDDSLLRELLRIFNREAIRNATGDVFGKIYEFFLNKFALTGAQEGGEFFTPPSLVNLIVHIIEPDHGIALDPAVGSAGMFIQTGHFIENKGYNPSERITIYGQEKTETNAKLAKMNLAVHGMEGDIQEGNTFYQDLHGLVGKCDFVMANPPFNVDNVDKDNEFVRNDSRLPFKLPKSDNANYLWIQYFYSYLNKNGRAGFVMASSASDAGHSEKGIRQKLIETGAVDVMVSIGTNFFYTRSLPCTLWFFDRKKEKDEVRKKQILMIDARNIFRKVTRKINDFTPEHIKNISVIASLYRGEREKYIKLVDGYIHEMENAVDALKQEIEDLQKPLAEYYMLLENVKAGNLKNGRDNSELFSQYMDEVEKLKHNEKYGELIKTLDELTALMEQYKNSTAPDIDLHNKKQLDYKTSTAAFVENVSSFTKHVQHYLKTLQKAAEALSDDEQKQIGKGRLRMAQKAAEESVSALHDLTEQVQYFHEQINWLQSRFPDAQIADVEGLCKVVDVKELLANDYSLTPGRYVGVTASAETEVDYSERLRDIHLELEGLNEESFVLSKIISHNFKELNI